MTYDKTSFLQGVQVGWRLGRWLSAVTLTVIWLDGDGSELDRKTYQQGAPEPTTDKIPEKQSEIEEIIYIFQGWDEGEHLRTEIIYRPVFAESGPLVITTMSPLCLSLHGSNVRINWGDGTVDTVNDLNYTEHSFAKSGVIYTVVFSGDIRDISFRDIQYDGITWRSQLLTVETPFPKSMRNMSGRFLFYGCTRLRSVPAGLFDNCTGLTMLDSCFDGTWSLETIPSDIFRPCNHVTDFSSIFQTSGIKSIPDGLFDYCYNSTSFRLAFSGSKITEIPAGLFRNCPLITDLSYCFSGCQISTIPETLFDSCVNAVSFSYCFSSTEIASIPPRIFNNCQNAENFSGTFLECKQLISIPSDLFRGLVNAITFDSCFLGCTSIVSIPEGLFDDCANVGSFNRCFSRCSRLKTIPITLFDNLQIKVNFAQCFARDRSIISSVPELWRSHTSGWECYYECYNAANYDDIPARWK